jgi:hypothetical protein
MANYLKTLCEFLKPSQHQLKHYATIALRVVQAKKGKMPYHFSARYQPI